MDQLDVDRYLARIGVARPRLADVESLEALQRAHLVAVPFENLDIVFAGGVPHDRHLAIEKILGGRGGWCFELNGSFAALLDAIGYEVMMIGAAVLLGGPSTVIDHLALEVIAPSDRAGSTGPRLVDVGFGAGFVRPLELNRGGPQDGGSGEFEFIASPQGTTLAEIVAGIPEARYRFKRVAHSFADFATAAASLHTDPNLHWHTKPFATRLLGPGVDRVTLTHDKLTVRRNGAVDERPVDRSEWDELLDEWFGMQRPGPWPAG